MGSVWAAHHELISRYVAIKVTDEKVAKRPDVRERFLNEARAVGRLRHPNIIDVMDFGDLPDGRLYIVFELLDGISLDEYIQSCGRLSLGEAATIALEIGHGLEAAHQAGVVHRDLKPANVFLHKAPTGGTVVKVLDFGISKSYDEQGVSLSMTQTGVVLGTPQYMSVEQARGVDDIDHRTDLWSLGVILFEMVTGELPFSAVNYNAMIYKIMHAEPASFRSLGVDVPPALGAVIIRCLAKSRSQRFQTATELCDALAPIVPTLPFGPTALQIERMTGTHRRIIADRLSPAGADGASGPANRVMTATTPPEMEAFRSSPPGSADGDVANGAAPDERAVRMFGRSKRRLLAVGVGAAVVVSIGIGVALGRRPSRALRDASTPARVGETFESAAGTPTAGPVAPATTSAEQPPGLEAGGATSGAPSFTARTPAGKKAAGRAARQGKTAPTGAAPKSVTKIDNAGF